MKCKRCGGRAVLELRRHNAAFCAPDFVQFFRQKTLETVRRWRMFTADDRVLVAVSGGKDSLALWDVLIEAGYQTRGLYIDLGIFDYSRESKAKCEAFVRTRGAALEVVSVADELGAAIPGVKTATRRPTCSACGLSKRYILNKAAIQDGFSVVATGHNLDDEAATLFGSTLRWDASALARQTPVLEATHPTLVRRVKPLFRLSERETAAYAFLSGIDYIVEECPFARGATSITHKEILNRMEEASPGSKASFFLNFLEQARHLFQAHDQSQLRQCERCGQTTTGDVCAFCKLRAQVWKATGPVSRRAAEPIDAAAERGLIAELDPAAQLHAS